MKSAFLTLLMLAAPAFAAEHEDLVAQRATIESRFAAESKECSTRFAVNACMDEARARRSAALKPVVKREQQLEAEDRRARAEAQAKRVQQRQQESAAAEAERLVAPIKASEPRPLRPEPKPHSVGDPQQRIQAEQSREIAAERQAENNRTQQAKRQQQLLVRRKDAARNAEKAKGAASLPVPSAAEIARLKQPASAPAKAASAASR
ncbi:hypothetical protein ACFJGW_21160 [Burkholderiaceae bacterium UC74_6]